MRIKGKFNTTITIPSHPDPDQADEVEVEVEIKYTYTPGTPAKLDALPEDCYPADGPEVEIETIREVNGHSAGPAHTWDFALLDERQQEQIEEEACLDVAEQAAGNFD